MRRVRNIGKTGIRALAVVATLVLSVGLTACSTTTRTSGVTAADDGNARAAGVSSTGNQAGGTRPIDPAVVAMYGPIGTEPFPIPAVDLSQIDPRYYRQRVPTPPSIAAEPGTIVVDPANRFLYLAEAGGTSMRYGIGVGRQGFSWTGEAVIKDKQAWPKWFPPPEMVARDPRAAPYADGMEGGPDNPLGARALYLYQGDKDTLFRLHGTYEQTSIGRAVSSGCIRLLNQDIIDLYERVPLGTKVVVLKGAETVPLASAGSAPGNNPI